MVKHIRLVLRIFLITTITLSATCQLTPTPAQVKRIPTNTNIVLIMTDDQDTDSLPVMRHLMSYPEGSWVNFTNAYANHSICCPARATVLTGQYAHTTGVTGNNKGANLDDTNTLPVWLDKAGYRTGLIGKYLNGYPWDRGEAYVPPGWDYFKTDGLGGLDGFTREALEFINTAEGPFFLYLAYRAPHSPAKPLPRYENANVYIPDDRPNFNEEDISDKPAWIRELPPLPQSTLDEWHAERIASQRALLGVDDGIQQIIEALKSKGQLENTMIIFMSDHGFSWGSHRYILKECVYEECSRFPLLIRYPGLTENREESRLVSNVDLADTIADYAGITPEIPQDGKSFIPLLTNTATDWHEEVLLERAGQGQFGFYGIRVPGWKYVEYGSGDVELYDLTSDPYELQNLAGQPDYRARQAELAQRLHTVVGDP
ncbi:MAG TPA: sulfatase [Anaerolineales bacterium]|nr:sulfatase [Anaerolineales bacterium]